jgi:hypothetical protein
MNKSNVDSQTPVESNAAQAASLIQPTDKQSDMPQSGDISSWLARGIVGMKRMHQDEAYRKEIAKKLS